VPSPLAAGTTALVCLLTTRWFDRRAGFCAGIVFAVIPMVTRMAQEARAYAFAMSFVALATLLLLKWWPNRDRRLFRPLPAFLVALIPLVPLAVPSSGQPQSVITTIPHPTWTSGRRFSGRRRSPGWCSDWPCSPWSSTGDDGP
jgi:mannosyltransferase